MTFEKPAEPASPPPLPKGVHVLEDSTVPAGAPWGRRLDAGEMLRIVDLHGCQAVDFLCYDAAHPAVRYSGPDTTKFAGTIYLSEGMALMGDLGYPLMTLVTDTVGFHDTIAGCCSAEGNLYRYGVAGTLNCRDNFLAALAAFGLGKKDIVPNVNLFMYVPVGANGGMAITEGRSRPGDYVELRAETDVIAVLSNCPQTRNPANAFQPTPIQVTVWR